ncbi:alpha/beta fold hydrolase [Mesomycoplasma conjunctivae]|uniref:alpha/beta fold hydrolase n=1 Tax=Mesomycoplasma conjunctivae TaxID=45361 RepID=UPI003DA23BC3
MKKINWNYPYIISESKENKINLVFCHGFNSNHSVFYQVISKIPGVNYYSFTLPGCNLTPAEPHQLNMEYYAQEIVRFIKELNLNEVVLVGHSMGAGNAALVYKLIPERIKKIAFIGPMNKANMPLATLFYNKFFPKTPQEMLDFFTIYEYDKEKYQDPKWLDWANKVFDYEYFNNKNIVQLGSTLPQYYIMDKIEEGLKEVKCPAMLILGERDGIMMKEETIQYYLSIIENIRVEVIPYTGHLIYTENEEGFLQVFKPFLLD